MQRIPTKIIFDQEQESVSSPESTSLKVYNPCSSTESENCPTYAQVTTKYSPPTAVNEDSKNKVLKISSKSIDASITKQAANGSQACSVNYDVSESRIP